MRQLLLTSFTWAATSQLWSAWAARIHKPRFFNEICGFKGRGCLTRPSDWWLAFSDVNNGMQLLRSCLSTPRRCMEFMRLGWVGHLAMIRRTIIIDAICSVLLTASLNKLLWRIWQFSRQRFCKHRLKARIATNRRGSPFTSQRFPKHTFPWHGENDM
jgi:hypothetical protein